jgi:putative transposase
VKYAWIQSHQKEFTVASMCEFLNVSRSCFYAWLNAPKTEREKENEALIGQLRILFQEGRGNYGTRRLKRKLQKLGKTVSRRRIGRLMKRAGLVCKTKRKFKVTTDSKHNLPIASNLLARQFTVEKPNQTFVGDITYVATQEGWLYLAVVIDLYSRQVEINGVEINGVRLEWHLLKPKQLKYCIKDYLK